MEGRHGVERPTPRLIQNGNGMEERSEEQVISRLFDLENSGQAAQRAELTGERFISLIQDPANGLGYVFQHGLDETEGAEVPEGTEYWEYPTWDEAERAYVQLLDEDRQATLSRRIPRKALATPTATEPRCAIAIRQATTTPSSKATTTGWASRPTRSPEAYSYRGIWLTRPYTTRRNPLWTGARSSSVSSSRWTGSWRTRMAGRSASGPKELLATTSSSVRSSIRACSWWVARRGRRSPAAGRTARTSSPTL